MANEMSVRVSVLAKKGKFKWPWNPGQVDADLAAGVRSGNVQAIGTNEEVLDFGDAGTFGWLFLRNLDDTNYVEYGPEDSGAMIPFGKLKPGELGVMRLVPGIVVRAQADTASCNVDVNLLDD